MLNFCRSPHFFTFDEYFSSSFEMGTMNLHFIYLQLLLWKKLYFFKVNLLKQEYRNVLINNFWLNLIHFNAANVSFKKIKCALIVVLQFLIRTVCIGYIFLCSKCELENYGYHQWSFLIAFWYEKLSRYLLVTVRLEEFDSYIFNWEDQLSGPCIK